jgi:hypothetical protein
MDRWRQRAVVPRGRRDLDGRQSQAALPQFRVKVTSQAVAVHGSEHFRVRLLPFGKGAAVRGGPVTGVIVARVESGGVA